MEKFGKNIGKNMRKVAMVGLSVLSMSPKVMKAQDFKSADFDNFLKNKKEWTRSELKLNKKSTEALAFSLSKEIFSKKEEYKKNTEENILYLNKELEFLSSDLNYRKLNNDRSTYLPSFSTREIQEKKNDLEEELKNNQKSLKAIENLEKYKEIPDSFIEEKVNDIQKIISYYDIGRQWVLDNLKDPIYIKRFKQENKESFPDMSTTELEEYIKKEISLREKQASDDKFLISKDIESSSRDKGRNLEAFYNPDNDKVYLPVNDNDSLRAINNIIHEYSHKITKANEFLSKKAIKLFLEAFSDSSTISHFRFTTDIGDISKIINYFSNPTEIYARKKVFEYDLERLGVKKYEEKFTMEHYKKVLELQSEDKLSKGSNEFINIIKPQMIEKVMNEIAGIDYQKEQTKNIT